MSEKEEAFDGSDISAEINAIIQNSDKKKISFTTSHFIEIMVDKKNSSVDVIAGEFAITTEKKFLDNSIEKKSDVKYRFNFNEKDGFVIEKYDQSKAINRDLMKIIVDSVKGIMSVASTSIMKFPINQKEAFQCHQKKILVICETGKNVSVQDMVAEMLFSGQANSHIDTGSWKNRCDGGDKTMKWAILELERRTNNGESVIVTGMFNNWYEFMPIAVIASMSGMQLVIGRTAGQKLSVGNVLDINSVLEHFSSNTELLSQFYGDPFSSIQHFKDVDNTINSLIIFPSVLHNFLTR